MQIGAGLIGLGLLFVILATLDAINGRWTPSSQATLWMAGFLALVGGVLVSIGVRSGRTMWRVADGGHSTEATVTAVTQGRMQTWIHEAPSWTIRYRYQDNLGDSFQGQTWNLTPDEAENWEVGDTAVIRFDDRRPGTSAWTGERGVSRAGPGSKRHAPPAPPSLFWLSTRAPSFWLGLPLFIVGVMALAFADAPGIYGLYLLPGPLLFLAGLRRAWI